MKIMISHLSRDRDTTTQNCVQCNREDYELQVQRAKKYRRRKGAEVDGKIGAELAMPALDTRISIPPN